MSGTPPRSHRSPQGVSDSLQALQQLAAGSPAKPAQQGSADSDYNTWVRSRVKSDTANLRRFAKKRTAEKALKSLPLLQAMGALYKRCMASTFVSLVGSPTVSHKPLRKARHWPSSVPTSTWSRTPVSPTCSPGSIMHKPL